MGDMMMAGVLAGKTGLIVALAVITILMIGFLMMLLRMRTMILGSMNEVMSRTVDRFILPSDGGGSLSATSSGSVTGETTGNVTGGGGGSSMVGQMGRSAMIAGASAVGGGVASSIFGSNNHSFVGTGEKGDEGADGADGTNGQNADINSADANNVNFNGDVHADGASASANSSSQGGTLNSSADGSKASDGTQQGSGEKLSTTSDVSRTMEGQKDKEDKKLAGQVLFSDSLEAANANANVNASSTSKSSSNTSSVQPDAKAVVVDGVNTQATGAGEKYVGKESNFAKENVSAGKDALVRDSLAEATANANTASGKAKTVHAAADAVNVQQGNASAAVYGDKASLAAYANAYGGQGTGGSATGGQGVGGNAVGGNSAELKNVKIPEATGSGHVTGEFSGSVKGNVNASAVANGRHDVRVAANGTQALKDATNSSKEFSQRSQYAANQQMRMVQGQSDTQYRGYNQGAGQSVPGAAGSASAKSQSGNPVYRNVSGTSQHSQTASYARYTGNGQGVAARDGGRSGFGATDRRTQSEGMYRQGSGDKSRNVVPGVNMQNSSQHTTANYTSVTSVPGGSRVASGGGSSRVASGGGSAGGSYRAGSGYNRQVNGSTNNYQNYGNRASYASSKQTVNQANYGSNGYAPNGYAPNAYQQDAKKSRNNMRGATNRNQGTPQDGYMAYDPSLENAEHGVSGSGVGDANATSRAHSGTGMASRGSHTNQGRVSNKSKYNPTAV